MMGGVFENHTVSASDFRNGLAYASTFTKMHFSRMIAGRCDFKGSVFTDCHFIECDISQCCFNSCRFVDCTFNDCDIDQSTFKAAIIKKTTFVGGRAEYADFSDSTLTDVTFDLQLHGADLRYASAENVSYGESNLWGASFTVSCNAFAGKELSERQLSLFLSLLGSTSGNDDLRASVLSLVKADYVKMLDKLANV